MSGTDTSSSSVKWTQNVMVENILGCHSIRLLARDAGERFVSDDTSFSMLSAKV